MKVKMNPKYFITISPGESIQLRTELLRGGPLEKAGITIITSSHGITRQRKSEFTDTISAQRSSTSWL